MIKIQLQNRTVYKSVLFFFFFYILLRLNSYTYNALYL